MNKTLIQFFHWYFPPEGNLWLHAIDKADHLVQLGITDVWLPPAYKSGWGVGEPGYAVYDLYDLGEFDQKGTIRTRYGTKEEYLHCIDTLHKKGLKVIADIVLNHKVGGDEKEPVPVVAVNDENRTEKTSDQHIVEAYTKYNFPGRKNKYSDYQWDWHSFTGICEQNTIHLVMNEYGQGTWEEVLDDELGNYDYLMGSDVEFRNPNVREELKRWAKWYFETTHIDGIRLDALKHINYNFMNEWVDYVLTHIKPDTFCIGEYWRSEIHILLKYQELTHGKIQLFDVPLHFNFYLASMQGKQYDLRTILNHTLVKENPVLAITFVDNHDTQPLQGLQSTVDYWFKPLANAIILLREQGIPCVFYPSLYEAKYTEQKNGEEIYVELNSVPGIETLLKVRKELAYGSQKDFFNDYNRIGWTRTGVETKPHSGCAVLLSNGDAGNLYMEIDKQFAGQTFVDAMGYCQEKIVLDENGGGAFLVNGGSVSVWVHEQALPLIS